MSEHTPGPWCMEKQSKDACGTAIGEPIAVVGGEATDESVEFVVGRACDFGPHGDLATEANARLIAAAPDLLEACKAARRHLLAIMPETGPLARQHQKAVGELSDAIAKAN